MQTDSVCKFLVEEYECMQILLLKFLEKKKNLAINRRQESMIQTFDIPSDLYFYIKQSGMWPKSAGTCATVTKSALILVLNESV